MPRSNRNGPRVPCTITAYPGGFEVEVPRYMVDNINSPGNKDSLCRRYANKLIGFREAFPRMLCQELLEPYGAWGKDDFDRMPDRVMQTTLLFAIIANADQSDTMNSAYITCYIGD